MKKQAMVETEEKSTNIILTILPDMTDSGEKVEENSENNSIYDSGFCFKTKDSKISITS
ncbi:hypothetical protein CPR19092_LGOLGGFK_02334 [Companilactobacillus paralimentarius]|uniref:hypothetical protein n=1 Tax=Companilactobacillus paralimentarius TaxID=83526 RepID=UPI0038512FF0